MRTVAVRYTFTIGVPVVDRYSHFGGISCLIGGDDFLFAVCWSEGKAAFFVKLDLCSVYGDGIYIFLVNGDRLCFTIGFAFFNAGDYRPNIVKRYAVGTKICYVQALINEHGINNIFSVGIYAKRFIVCIVHKRAQLRLGEILIRYKIGNKHGSAVVGGIYRYLLRILKE